MLSLKTNPRIARITNTPTVTETAIIITVLPLSAGGAAVTFTVVESAAGVVTFTVVESDVVEILGSEYEADRKATLAESPNSIVFAYNKT